MGAVGSIVGSRGPWPSRPQPLHLYGWGFIWTNRQPTLVDWETFACPPVHPPTPDDEIYFVYDFIDDPVWGEQGEEEDEEEYYLTDEDVY